MLRKFWNWDFIALAVIWLGILALLLLPTLASAQCSSGGCGSGGTLRPMAGLLPSFQLTPATEPGPMYEPTHDAAAMMAKGYAQETDPQTGKTRWSRIVAVDGKPLTTLAGGCSDGSCGLGSRRAPAKSPDWNAAPRGDRPPMASTPAPAAPSSPPKPSEPFSQQPLDLDKLANLLVDKLAADARFKGPKGDAGRDGLDGMPGPAGPAGRDGKDADEAVIVAAVLAKIDYDAIAARVKSPTIPISNPSHHYVLVANQSASYWPRLAGELARAQEAYSSIDVVPDPGNVGQMPQLVLYEGSTPLQVFKGPHEVSGQLALLSR